MRITIFNWDKTLAASSAEREALGVKLRTTIAENAGLQMLLAAERAEMLQTYVSRLDARAMAMR